MNSRSHYCWDKMCCFLAKYNRSKTLSFGVFITWKKMQTIHQKLNKDCYRFVEYMINYIFRWWMDRTYWMYSTMILSAGLETDANASLDIAMVEEHLGQKSITLTSIVPPLHGLLLPLRHFSLYFLPQAAPLSHNPSPTATNKLPGGNWSCLFPLHLVASQISSVRLKRSSMHEIWVCKKG